MKKNISIEEICQVIYSGVKIAVITGAGVSDASGIKPFRDENGNYQIENGEYLLSIDCFNHEPEKFYTQYKKNILKPNKGPNITHITLAQLQKAGYIGSIITQNIDGLHGQAGSENVIELHGNGTKFYCSNPECRKCHKVFYTQEQYEKSDKCPKCGNTIRPDIVLYGEFSSRWDKANNSLIDYDVVLILGASLIVQDIQSLLNEYRRKKDDDEKAYHLIIINKSETWFDFCSSVCRDDLSKVFEQIQAYGIANGYLKTVADPNVEEQMSSIAKK